MLAVNGKALSPFLMAVAILWDGSLSANVQTLLDDDWYHSEWNNVTIVSNAKKSDSETIARGVEDFLQNIHRVLPYPTRSDTWPLRIYICKDLNTFTQLAPQGTKYETNVSGIFTEGLGYDVIILLADVSQQRLREIVYHELVHREMRSQDNIPLWLDEGLAEVYSNFRFRKKHMLYALSDPRHRNWIQRNGTTSLRRLFHVNHGSPEYNHINLSTSFYATSWIFTHYCLFAENGAFEHAFFDFIEASKKQMVSEEMFTQYFGMNYETMSKQLLSYARGFRFPSGKIALPSSIKNNESQFIWLPNTQLQSQVLLSGAMTLSRRFNEANELLNTIAADIYKTGSLRLQNAEKVERATLAFFSNDFPTAYRYATSAYQSDNRSPTTLLLHSQYLLKTAPGRRIDYRITIPLPDVNRAFRCINQVLEAAPRHALACRLYTLAWLRTNAEPSPAQYEKLLQNTRLMGDDSELAFLTADLFALHRKFRDARLILKYFADHTSSKEAKDDAHKRMRNLPKI